MQRGRIAEPPRAAQSPAGWRPRLPLCCTAGGAQGAGANSTASRGRCRDKKTSPQKPCLHFSRYKTHFLSLQTWSEPGLPSGTHAFRRRETDQRKALSAAPEAAQRFPVGILMGFGEFNRTCGIWPFGKRRPALPDPRRVLFSDIFPQGSPRVTVPPSQAPRALGRRG